MAATYLLMSYIILAIFAVILMCSESTAALTAFGKSSTPGPNTNKSASPPKSRAKACNDNSECKVPYSRCMYNQIEGKKHCTCPDGSMIDNGACRLKGLGPGSVCANSPNNKCAPGSDCLYNKTLNKKICVCEDGFFDDDTTEGFRFCNGASILLLPDANSLLLGFAVFGVIRTLLHSH